MRKPPTHFVSVAQMAWCARWVVRVGGYAMAGSEWLCCWTGEGWNDESWPHQQA